MLDNPVPARDRFDNPRDDPRFADLFRRRLEELKDNGFVDPDEILAEDPDLGPAVLEDLETYIQLSPGEGPDFPSSPLGTLGDYTLRRRIGRGGMGVVYEAWENSMDRPVALKVLPPGIAADDKTFQRFCREAKLAGKLSHPNIVPVFGMGIKEDTPHYAMEYVEGDTLAQILSGFKGAEPELETPFGPRDRQDFFIRVGAACADVAEALQHAHSKGVVHRDIKPSNVILDREGRLRILDFGLAHLEGQESLTVSGDLIGTVLYMSPEQAMAKRIPLDHRTDVYSLGATMYELITGEPPFQGKDQQDTLSQIIVSEPRPPRRLSPGVPKDLETIVLKCLRKAPGYRYGTAEALAQDLRRFVRGDPIEARPEATWQRLFSRMRRHRVALYGVAALLSVGCAVAWLGALLWQTQRERAREELKAQINADLYDGKWGAAVELGREAIEADERDVEALLLLGTALKHDLSASQTTADEDSVLEFLKVARRAWKLEPEDRDARYLLRAARATAAMTLARNPTLESSNAVESALADVSTVLPFRFHRGDKIVEDFVTDADLRDGRPLWWHHVRPGESEPSPDGDGLDVWQNEGSHFGFATDEVFAGEVRVGARAALRGTRFGDVALIIHGGPGDTCYIGSVRSRPEEIGGSSVIIIKWRRGQKVRTESADSSITAEEEVQVELCSTLAAVEFRVWHPGLGEERPAAANVTMDDAEYRVGSVGLAGGVPQGARSGGATLRFRWFSVTVLP